MAQIVTNQPREQIIDALGYVRKSRHHPDCRCGNYQRLWCNAEEKLWCTAVDRLLRDIVPPTKRSRQ